MLGASDVAEYRESSEAGLKEATVFLVLVTNLKLVLHYTVVFQTEQCELGCVDLVVTLRDRLYAVWLPYVRMCGDKNVSRSIGVASPDDIARAQTGGVDASAQGPIAIVDLSA